MKYPPHTQQMKNQVQNNLRTPNSKIDEDAQERNTSKDCSDKLVPEEELSRSGHRGSGILMDMESSLALRVEEQLKE